MAKTLKHQEKLNSVNGLLELGQHPFRGRWLFGEVIRSRYGKDTGGYDHRGGNGFPRTLKIRKKRGASLREEKNAQLSAQARGSWDVRGGRLKHELPGGVKQGKTKGLLEKKKSY